MSISLNVQRSKIFKELTEDIKKEYFNLNEKKYLHHVDSFYYSCFLESDSSNGKVPVGVLELIDFLKFCRYTFDKTKEEFYVDEENELLFTKKRSKMYNYCISKQGFFDIFIAESLPNDNTPRVLIQLRSIGLWSIGEHQLIINSYNALVNLLNRYNVKVFKTQENRIDWCYHTNSIQNPSKFYNDDTLVKNLKTSFKIYSKVGRLNDKNLTVEYLSLGNRKSNNVFFRSYNKVREVIEENYKEFFFDIWLQYGLISKYDYEVFRYAYQYSSYERIYWGMLEFYINHGTDLNILKEFMYLRDNPNTTLDQVRNAVKGILPFPTLIVNLEWQTMRKFYFSGLDIIQTLPIEYDLQEPNLLELFQILDNRKIFLEYLTSFNCVGFVKDKDIKRNEEYMYMDFWRRLRSTKLDVACKCIYKRKYPKNINIDLLTKKIKGSLATLSLYHNNFSTDINEDMSNLISILNDNDMKINDDGSCSVIDKEYNRIKEKKKKALKSIIRNANQVLHQ